MSLLGKSAKCIMASSLLLHTKPPTTRSGAPPLKVPTRSRFSKPKMLSPRYLTMSLCSLRGTLGAKSRTVPKRSTYLLSSIAILEVRSFHINPAGYIAEPGTSVATAACSGLNFVQIRHCNGGMSPWKRARYMGTQCFASSNRMTMAELQQVATTRLVVDFSSILKPSSSSAPFEYFTRSLR